MCSGMAGAQCRDACRYRAALAIWIMIDTIRMCGLALHQAKQLQLQLRPQQDPWHITTNPHEAGKCTPRAYNAKCSTAFINWVFSLE